MMDNPDSRSEAKWRLLMDLVGVVLGVAGMAVGTLASVRLGVALVALAVLVKIVRDADG